MHLYLSSLSIFPLLLSSPPSLLSSSSIHTLTLPTPPSSLPPAGFYCPPVLLPPITRSSSSSPLGNQAELTDVSSCGHKRLNYNAALSQLTPFELVLTIVFLMASLEPTFLCPWTDGWQTEIIQEDLSAFSFNQAFLESKSEVNCFTSEKNSFLLQCFTRCHFSSNGIMVCWHHPSIFYPNKGFKQRTCL